MQQTKHSIPRAFVRRVSLRRSLPDRVPHAAYRVPLAAYRVPHAAYRVPHAAYRVPREPVREPRVFS